MFQSLIGIIDNWNESAQELVRSSRPIKFQSLIGIIDNWNNEQPNFKNPLSRLFQSLIGIIDNWNLGTPRFYFQKGTGFNPS